MKRAIRTFHRHGLLVVSVLLTLSACGSGGGIGDGNTLASIAITDSRFVRPNGFFETFQCFPGQLRLLGTFDDGSLDTTLTPRASWSSSNPNIVQVSNGNLTLTTGESLAKGALLPSAQLTAIGQPVTITAEFVGLSASIDVIVRPGTLEVSPTQVTLAPGTTLQMFATAILGGGTTDTQGTNRAIGFNDGVIWESTNPTAAKIDENTGIVTAVTGGQATTIRAKAGVDCSTPQRAETPVSVTTAALQSISLQPTTQFSLADIGRNSRALLLLVGNFANNFRQELNRELSGAAVLESSAQDTDLSVTGALVLSPSTATHNAMPVLTARFDPDGAGGQTEVSTPTNTTINGNKRVNTDGFMVQPVPPNTGKMLAGTAMDLDAIGNYVDAGGADQPDQNLYRDSFWTSSVPATVSVNSVTGRIFTSSVVTTATTADITATRFEPVLAQTITGMTTITVVPFAATSVQSMQVTCPATIPLNSAADCTATINFVGGGSQDVSLYAIWSSSNSNPAVADIGNAQAALLRENETNRPIAPSSLASLSTRTPLSGRIFTGPTTGQTTITATLFDADGTQLATGSAAVNISGAAALDTDQDGVPDSGDNCPNDPNNNQANADGDGLGDVCDPDDDNDGVADGTDQCPLQSQGTNPSNSRSGCPCNDPNPLFPILGPACNE